MESSCDLTNIFYCPEMGFSFIILYHFSEIQLTEFIEELAEGEIEDVCKVSRLYNKKYQ